MLLALAAERFGPGRRRELRRIGREPVSAEDVARLAAELRRCGVIEEVEGLIAASVLAAERTLASPLVDPRAARGLRRLAGRMAWRES